jgi:hypothetical protein
LLLRIHKIEPITGSVLCLGRQRIMLREEQLRAVFAKEGVKVHHRFNSLAALETDEKCPSQEGCLTDRRFFAAFGISDLHSMDVSPYEGADIIHDLNFSIPDELAGRFDFVIDGGTFDHLVDIRMSFQNLIRLLSPHGRTFMWNAASNFFPLCYFTFSPEVFEDIFRINNFSFCKTCLAVINEPAQREGWDLYQFGDLAKERHHFTSPRSQMVLVYAKRKPESTHDQLPIQANYRTHISYELEDGSAMDRNDPFVGSTRRRTLSEWTAMWHALRYSFGSLGATWKGRV